MREIPVCSRCGNDLNEVILKASASSKMKFRKEKGQYEDYKKLENWKIKIGRFECPNCNLQKRFIQDLAISPEEYKKRQRPPPPKYVKTS